MIDDLKLVTVVGVGALGSHVVPLLRNERAEITVIDYDRVEQKNVASQFHARGTVGKKKVLGLQKSMSFLFGRSITATPHRIVEGNLDLLEDEDLVIDCLDNAESRGLVQRYCKEQGIPCLHGALDAAGSFGRVIWSEGFVIDEEPAEGAATCEDGEFLPFIAITAAYVAKAAQAFLRHGKKGGFTISPVGVFST
jgi:molybdopterin/thiamine biosynthesis adenylyltransferase